MANFCFVDGALWNVSVTARTPVILLIKLTSFGPANGQMSRM